MLRKKFIFENDEEMGIDEMSDYEKLMRLAKKRLNYGDVHFENSEGEDFGDTIEVTQDGLLFTFDGLQEYLTFFFPDEYGKEDKADGYYEAQYYESMYNGSWDWYNEFSDRDQQDWGEGYITDKFKKNHLELVRDIAKIASPNLYSKISKMLDKGKPLDSDLNFDVRNFLEILDLQDDIIGLHIDSNVEAVRNEVPKEIKNTYCDCLNELGIERYSEKYCFWKYEMDWGSCMMLYARFGIDEDNFLDLLFNTIRKTIKSHLPEYYEMPYNYFDNEEFEATWSPGLTRILENKLRDIEENPENYHEDYFEVLNKVMSLGGMDVFIDTKDGKYQIKIHSIEPDTSLIRYLITRKGDYRTKAGKTDIDGLMSLFYNEKLFDVMEHKEKFSILRNETFL